jgi:hypothetical protein
LNLFGGKAHAQSLSSAPRPATSSRALHAATDGHDATLESHGHPSNKTYVYYVRCEVSQCERKLENCSCQLEERDSAAMAETGKPRVVVVGGGIGGALLAKTMEPDADVVLLDP